jgi:hypothetical protein
MALTIQEYLRRAEQNPVFASPRESQDVRNALQAISSYQTSKAVGEALGADATAAPKKGIITRVLGDVLGAPGRAVKAGVADIIGFDDPRLRQQGVLGSAMRGFRGDIDITGGDFIKTRPSDSRLQRAAKLAGAFAIDVGLDPITYIGTPAALGRQAAMKQAGFTGGKILRSAAEQSAKRTGTSPAKALADLQEQMFNRSSQGRYFSELRKSGASADDIEKAMRSQVNPTGKLSKEAVDAALPEFKRTVAENEMGRLVGESLWFRGRQGVVSTLSDVLGDEKVARGVFESLDPRIRGGLYFVNPFTGREIVRVTPGTGESLGALGVALNTARARVATFTGRGTSKISGERGQALQLMKEDIVRTGDVQSLINRQMTLSDFVGEKQMARIARVATANLGVEFKSVTSQATALRAELKDVSAEKFNRDLLEGFFSPNAVREGVDPRIHAMGVRMAHSMDRVRDDLIKAGADVGDLGDTYFPLFATKEGRDQLARSANIAAKRLQVAGTTSGDIVVDVTKGRQSYYRILPSDKTPADYGTLVDEATNQVALKPELANIVEVADQFEDLLSTPESVAKMRAFFDTKIDEAAAGKWSMPDEVKGLIDQLADQDLTYRVGSVPTAERIVLKTFETDPFKVISTYYAGAAPRIARAEAIQAGVRSGVLQVREGEQSRELTERVGKRFMAMFQQSNSAVRNNPKIKKLIEDGLLTEEHMTALGILDDTNMARIMNSMQLERNLPNTAQQAVAIEEALEVLGMQAQSGRTLSEAQLGPMRKAAEVLESTEDFIKSVDSLIGELIDLDLNTLDIDLLVLASRQAQEGAEVVGRAAQREVGGVLQSPDGAAIRALLEARRDAWKGAKGLRDVTADDVTRLRDIITTEDRVASVFGLERIGAVADSPGIISTPEEYAQLRAIKGVRALIEARHRVVANPDKIKKFFTDVYEPGFMMWKTGATVGRGPGYTFLNMVGNLYMNHLGGISAADHALSARVMLAARDAAKEAAENAAKRGVKVSAQEAPSVLAKETDDIFRRMLADMPNVGDKTMYDALQDFLKAGGIDSSQTAEALNVVRRLGVEITPSKLGATSVVRQSFDEPAASAIGRGAQNVVELVMNNPYQRFANSVNTNVETWTRFAAYMDGYRGTQSIDSALERMFLLQFDYGDLSSGDRIARSVMPFYVWTRNNVPAQFRAMFVQPGKIRKFMAAQDAFKSALEADPEDSWLEQVLPEYIGEAGGFASGMKSPEGHNVAFAGKLPYHDIERLFQVGGRFGLIGLNRREIVQMFGPFLTGVEMVAGRDISTGGEFDPAGVEATGWRSALGVVPGLGRTGQYGERRIPRGIEKFTSELLPQVGTAERALTGAAAGARMLGAPEGVARAIESPAGATMRERGLSNLLNVSGVSPLLGVSATTLTPRTISSSVRGRSRRQQAVINEASGRMEISQEWVRQELRRGFTPEEIAIRIAQGEGRLEDWEREQQAKQRPPSERYGTILQDLRQGPGITSLGYQRPQPSPRPAVFGGR